MLKEIKLTILAENRVTNPNLIAEQGFSVFIETPNGNILFDTGQTDAFIHNAQHLQIDLQSIKKIVLSHGHYDHTGGLRSFLNEVKGIEVICHPAIINKKYRIYPEGRSDIGVPWEKNELESLGAKFIFKTNAYQVLPHVWTSGEIPRNTSYENIDEVYQQRVSESYIQDEMHDDLALIIETQEGLIIILGCGHAGTINSIRHAMRITGGKKIYAIMGGMHLNHASEEKIEKIVHNLFLIDPAFVIPLHCTGFSAINRIFNQFKRSVKLLNVGDTFELENV